MSRKMSKFQAVVATFWIVALIVIGLLLLAGCIALVS